MSKAMIFNIQKFSLHDGPGIRTTVFFKGCPLKCLWCHNPESQNTKQEMLYDRDKCIMCGMCAKVCPEGAISAVNDAMVTDLSKCTFCGKCVIYCIPEAREIVGKEYTVDQVLQEALKDRVFYEESGGGVTLSGGEPLVQVDFIEELLAKLQAEGIHTAVDTCGAAPFTALERVAKYTDLFLYDLKLIDDQKHLHFTGGSNREIIQNLQALSRIHNNIQLRMPIIEGVNADDEHLKATIELIKDLNIKEVHLLPYHALARHKYSKLGRKYQDTNLAVPSEEKMDQLADLLLAQGINVKKEGNREGLY